MLSTMMAERAGMGLPGMALPGMTTGAPSGMPTGMSWLMVPRCTFKVEKCPGGFKMTCVCEDKTASAMVQNLCTMLAGGLCSCCVTLNGLTVCCYNFTMCLCKCEPTKDGVTVTCTSGDPRCAEMTQACCDCLGAMLKAGCCCCLLLNNNPVCCGSC